MELQHFLAQSGLSLELRLSTLEILNQALSVLDEWDLPSTPSRSTSEYSSQELDESVSITEMRNCMNFSVARPNDWER